MCKNSSLAEVVAFITTCIAIPINCFGVFSKTWWIDLHGEQYGMFTVVNCTDVKPCELGDQDTYGWMVVAQVTSLIQLITLLTSLFIQMVGFGCFKYQTHFLNIVILGISLFFSVLHILLLVSVYTGFMSKMHNSNLPENYIYFQTLPAGLNAIAGTVTIPALVTFIVLYTKELKNKRDVIKEAERERSREESIRKRSSVREKKPEESSDTQAADSNA